MIQAKIMILLLCVSLLGVNFVHGECVVESHRCGFPFSSSTSTEAHYSCQADGNKHFCYSQVGERHVYGVCNGGCYEDDGETPIIFEEEDAMAFFCKTAATPCIFPFSWNGTTYHSCTSDGSDFSWCALEVDDQGIVVGNKWGSCDMSTCNPEEEDVDDKREARAEFKDEVSGVVLLTQALSINPLKVEGRLDGVPRGQYRFRVLKEPCGDDSTDVSSDMNDDLIESDGDTIAISLEKWGISIYDNEESVLGGSISIEEECYLGEESLDCSEAKVVACANIVQGSGDGWNLTIIIIIALVVCILIIIILVGVLIFCCLRRRLPPSKSNPPHPDHSSMDSIDDPYLESRRSKSPLYDELSIPFIDASLPPTPKIGRSSNPLDILLGKHTESRTSLSDTT